VDAGVGEGAGLLGALGVDDPLVLGQHQVAVLVRRQRQEHDDHEHREQDDAAARLANHDSRSLQDLGSLLKTMEHHGVIGLE
jgi:hypothetical protein